MQAVDNKEAPGSEVGLPATVIRKCQAALRLEEQRILNLLSSTSRMIEFGDGGDTAANRALVGSYRHRLLITVWALERIEDGTFGICVDCRRLISEGRLLALPRETRCFDCQTKHGRG